MLVQIITDAITYRLDHAAVAAVLARETRIRAEPTAALDPQLDDDTGNDTRGDDTP